MNELVNGKKHDLKQQKEDFKAARETIFSLYKMMSSDTEYNSYLMDNDSFIHEFYNNITNEIINKNYEILLNFYKNTANLYRRMSSLIENKKREKLIFDIGRIVGSSQVAFKISDNLYDEIVSVKLLDKLSVGKGLKEILFYCVKKNKVYNQELCQYFDIQPNNLNKKMQYLLAFDLVDRHQIGRKVYYTTTPKGQNVFDQLSPKTQILWSRISYTQCDDETLKYNFLKSLDYDNRYMIPNDKESESVRYIYDRQSNCYI